MAVRPAGPAASGSDVAELVAALQAATAAAEAATAAAVAATAAANAAVPTSRTVSAGTGLTGGGALSADRALALSASSISSLALADSAVQPDDITTLDGGSL